ncbi:MAG: ATP-dependent zinc protease [Wenzhouxiangellaceae bacterium]
MSRLTLAMRWRRRQPLAAIVLCSLLAGIAGNANAVEQQIFGWVERVEIIDGRFTFKAKLDSGAATSSLDASDIETFRRDGKKWVRFTITNPHDGEPVTLERRHQRTVRIIRHSGKHQRRQVVSINVCLGKRLFDIEVSLIDRGEFIYPLLLGRSALEKFALIDPGETFLSKPRCDYPLDADEEKD